MSYSHYKSLGVAIDNGVATVTLQSGEPFNSVTWEMHHELSTIFQALNTDPCVQVIVVTGAGEAFCAGANLTWLRGQLDTPMDPLEARQAARGIVLGYLDCTKPIIARVNGDAIGLGATLAVLADIVIMADSARIADPHVRIGLVAGDGGAVIWPLLVGYARAKEFLLTGNAVSAPDAVAMGLVNRSVPREQLDEVVGKFVRQIMTAAPLAVRFTKAAVNIPLRQAVESVLEASLAFETITMRSDDIKEGVDAFLQKRKPEFKGR